MERERGLPDETRTFNHAGGKQGELQRLEFFGCNAPRPEFEQPFLRALAGGEPPLVIVWTRDIAGDCCPICRSLDNFRLWRIHSVA